MDCHIKAVRTSSVEAKLPEGMVFMARDLSSAREVTEKIKYAQMHVGDWGCGCAVGPIAFAVLSLGF
jgi:hypothetical protein